MKKKEILRWLEGRVSPPTYCGESGYAKGYKDGLRAALGMVEMLDEPEEPGEGIIQIFGARTALAMPDGEIVRLFGDEKTLRALRWALIDEYGEERRKWIADAILDSVIDYKEEVKRHDRKRKEDSSDDSGSPAGDVR